MSIRFNVTSKDLGEFSIGLPNMLKEVTTQKIVKDGYKFGDSQWYEVNKFINTIIDMSDYRISNGVVLGSQETVAIEQYVFKKNLSTAFNIVSLCPKSSGMISYKCNAGVDFILHKDGSVTYNGVKFMFLGKTNKTVISIPNIDPHTNTLYIFELKSLNYVGEGDFVVCSNEQAKTKYSYTPSQVAACEKFINDVVKGEKKLPKIYSDASLKIKTDMILKRDMDILGTKTYTLDYPIFNDMRYTTAWVGCEIERENPTTTIGTELKLDIQVGSSTVNPFIMGDMFKINVWNNNDFLNNLKQFIPGILVEESSVFNGGRGHIEFNFNNVDVNYGKYYFTSTLTQRPSEARAGNWLYSQYLPANNLTVQSIKAFTPINGEIKDGCPMYTIYRKYQNGVSYFSIDIESIVNTELKGVDPADYKDYLIIPPFTALSGIPSLPSGVISFTGTEIKPDSGGDPFDPPKPQQPDDTTTGGNQGGDQPDGGGGPQNWVDDPIELPPLPDEEKLPTRTILFSLWKPSITQLKSFANFLWGQNTNFWTEMLKKFNEPINSIISFKVFPLEPISGADKPLVIAGYNTEQVMTPLARQYREFDMGSIKIERYWNSFLDYDPYTKITIYIPFVGDIPLSTNDVMGKTLNIKYRIDYLTGSCLVVLLVDNNVYYQWDVKICYDLPLSGKSYDVLGITNAITTTLMQTAMFGTMGGAAGVIGSIDDVGKALYPDVKHTGAMGQSIGAMGVVKPYLRIIRPRTNIPKTYGSEKGYMCNMSRKLSDLKGFTVVEDINLQGLECTAEELKMIEEELKSGVIL